MDKYSVIPRLTILGICISLAYGLSDSQNIIKVSKQGSIITRFSRQSRQYPLGEVQGAHSCGGPGMFLELRYVTCKSSDHLCEAPADGVMRTSQMDFIPSSNITQLGARFVVKSTDEVVSVVLDEGGLKSTTPIIQGEKYTLTIPGGANSQLKGKTVYYKYILYRLDSDEVEVCAEGFANFY